MNLRLVAINLFIFYFHADGITSPTPDEEDLRVLQELGGLGLHTPQRNDQHHTQRDDSPTKQDDRHSQPP